MPGAGRSFHMKRGRTYRGKRRYRRKLATVATVKRMINSNEERKFVDTLTVSTSLQPSTTAGTITYISGTTEGDGEDNRDGRECRLHTIQMRGTVLDDPTSTKDTLYRVVIVRKNGATGGTLPAVDDIFDSALDVSTMPLVTAKPEYKIIYDKTMRGVKNSTIGHRWQKSLQYYKKWKTARVLNYIGAGSTIAAAGKGHFFLITLSNQGAADAPTINVNVRLSFTG